MEYPYPKMRSKPPSDGECPVTFPTIISLIVDYLQACKVQG